MVAVPLIVVWVSRVVTKDEGGAVDDGVLAIVDEKMVPDGVSEYLLEDDTGTALEFVVAEEILVCDDDETLEEQ